MARMPLPEEERRGKAVLLACRVLLANDIRVLPPDPLELARPDRLDFCMIPLLVAKKAQEERPHDWIRSSVGEEAFTMRWRGRYIVAYNDTVANAELEIEQLRVLEEEANTFARNILCPPPIVDLIRGDPRDPKWARLFCVSHQAWQVRLRTMAVDRQYVDQKTAEDLRAQFREYLYGRRCRDCGAVFTDEAGAGRCPQCGCKYLRWNPRMESLEQAVSYRHAAGAAAEDLAPRMGEKTASDLSMYWELLRKK